MFGWVGEVSIEDARVATITRRDMSEEEGRSCSANIARLIMIIAKNVLSPRPCAI
jgi:hypothetical protein